MTRAMRVVVLVTALMSLFAAVSTTAGAVTWHNTGDTAFTATGGAATPAATGESVTCSSSDFRGTTGASPFVGATWAAATGTGAFTGCKLAGVTTAITCAYTFTATAWAAGPPSVTSGVADATCALAQGGVTVCHIEGATPGTYTNPSGTTKGKLTLSASNTLKTTNPASGTCPLGNGDPFSLTMQTINVTSATGGGDPLHPGPVNTRTP